MCSFGRNSSVDQQGFQPVFFNAAYSFSWPENLNEHSLAVIFYGVMGAKSLRGNGNGVRM